MSNVSSDSGDAPATVTVGEAEFEKRMQWSAAGGRHAALREVHERLLAKAGELFSQGSDAQASLVRELAREFKVKTDKASQELNEFIRWGQESAKETR